MKRNRLPILLAFAAALAAVRWWYPQGSDDADANAELVPAVERRERGLAASGASTLLEAATPASVQSFAAIDLPGNAFSVRVPPVPPMPPAPPPPPIEKPFIGPPAPPPYVAPPPPPPPPLQIVGTWDDGQAPGVFITTPHGGAVLARVGTLLLAEYKVTAVTPQHVALTHTSSRHEWRLPIPRAGSRP